MMITTKIALAAAGFALAAATTTLLDDPTGYTERDFPIHNIESAPEASRRALETAQQRFNMVPHVIGVMAASPALVNSYLATQDQLQEHGALTPPENNIVQLAVAVQNECQYCVAGHTMAGKAFFGSSDLELEALRTGAKLPKEKFNALRTFAVQVYESRGRISDEQLEAFLRAGYARAHALDVVANISAKVMTNFTNQLARTPIDDAFAPLAEGLPFAEERKLKSTPNR